MANSMKIVKIFLPIALLISVTTPLSTSNTTNNLSYSSITELLKHYNLPTGLFPDAVSKFDLKYIKKDTYNVTIYIDIPKSCFLIWCIETCMVRTPEFKGEYSRTVTATISESQVTNLKGFSASFLGTSGPFFEVNEVQAYLNTAYQFKSEKLGFSPVRLFEKLKKPPVCDRPYGFGPSHLLDA